MTGVPVPVRLKLMKIISLTGGIGSGKSCVAGLMEKMGATIIDADKVAHEIIDPGTPGWQEIITTFGRGILTAQETVDRNKLAQIVFNNPEDLKKLNRITHPKVNEAIRTAFQKYRQQGADVVVVEVQIITGADWVHLTDEVWVVNAPREVKIKRLRERGLPESEALKRMASQMPIDEKAYSKVVNIDNSGTLEQLKIQVEKLWYRLHNKGEGDRGKRE